VIKDYKKGIITLQKVEWVQIDNLTLEMETMGHIQSVNSFGPKQLDQFTITDQICEAGEILEVESETP
jgi:uncharacterized protein YjbK